MTSDFGMLVYILVTAAHYTIRGTTHHRRTRGRTDEGISQKLNLRAEAQQFHQQF
jgi:hypothetical protein